MLELIFRNITFYFADLSLIRIDFWKICGFQGLEHDPTELHVWLSGEVISTKTRSKIT